MLHPFPRGSQYRLLLKFMPCGYELLATMRFMEFHQLRYFIAAAEELSISRAAARLHVSQPAMSRQIAVLEEEPVVPLVDLIR